MKDLKKIADQLKSEFIAIDYVIDHVIDSIKVWLESDKINSPSVICLWGMTGCGKTRLVRRLLELLDLKDESFYFNMVNQKKARESLDEIIHNDEDRIAFNSKSIFVLDEFQNCNTIKETTGERIDREELSIIWDLLDSGRFSNKKFAIDSWKITPMMNEFEAINKDDRLKTKTIGEIKKILDPKKEKTKKKSSRHDFHMFEPDSADIQLTTDMNVLNFNNYAQLLQVTGKLRNENYTEDYMKEKANFDNKPIQEIMSFYRTYMFKYILVEYDFSKALFFILGNLDDLYMDADDMNSDKDADILYENSKRLTPQDTKRILTGLFKPEQISRLGNNHVIYKAFSRKNYYDLIRIYLEDVNKRFGTNMEFDRSVLEMIYKEGVFPTQGVRPIISTIKYTIENNVNLVLNDIGKKKVSVKFSRGYLIINDDKKIKLNLINSIPIISKTDLIYKRICIHESGHAYVQLKMMNSYPQNVAIKINSSDPSGISQTMKCEDAVTPDHIKTKICCCLAGMIAEELVFGDFSGGNYMDRDQATRYIDDYIVKYGMSKNSDLFLTKRSYQDMNMPVRDLSEESKFLSKECYNQTKKLLKDNIEDLKKIVKVLYDKGKMNRRDFARLFPELKVVEDKRFEQFIGE